MKKTLSLFLVSVFLLSACKNPSPKLNSPTPESLGISSQSILDFIEAAEKTRKDDIHSFILLRHGEIAARGFWNPYNPDSPHMLFSLSKSFTSTAIGIAQSEGLLNINDKVISFFPDVAPANPSQNLQSMRIRDLLRMNTGHNEDATGRMRKDTVSWVKAFLSLEVENKPGTRFVYNSAATFMLSAIIQKVSGETLLEYLTPRLFEPLGIENPSWESAPGGINTGGWGLKIRTKDIASFGQLYLQKGTWQGKQLVPSAWIEEATKLQTANGSDPDSDWDQGYGYQFWRCRNNLYRGDGAFGQYCIVFPEQDAVMAITSGTSDMGAIMNLVWEKLLPAMKDMPLEENKSAYDALQAKLISLSLSLVKGEPSSPISESISKKVYKMEPNNEGVSEMSVDLQKENPSINFNLGSKSMLIPYGMGAMVKGVVSMPSGGEEALATSAAWISPDSLQLRSYLYETPFYYTYTLAFKGDIVSLARKVNVGFGPAAPAEIKGVKKN
jgi:CubicO group peptidase (beta-lactamase class C family)